MQTEEEKEFYEERGPLAKGKRGKIQNVDQPRLSFFCLRFTGEELTLLRDKAKEEDRSVSSLIRKRLFDSLAKERGNQ